MYNIHISLVRNNWVGIDVQSEAKTTVKAFMDAVRLVRRLLYSTKVEFLPINQTEFVIWLQGKCKGYLSVKPVGPTI